jgi:hypothetical protein
VLSLRAFCLLPLLALLPSCAEPGMCIHGKNWIYKTGIDPQVAEVSLTPVPTTIDELRAIPAMKRTADGRLGSVERTTYVLRDVELKLFQRALDGDVHLVLADEHGHTLIVEAAPPFCTDVKSPWRKPIDTVRAVVDKEIPMSVTGFPRRTISVAGPGYFDPLHGQTGVAPNGIELHPVMAICFGKGCTLPPIEAAQP